MFETIIQLIFLFLNAGGIAIAVKSLSGPEFSILAFIGLVLNLFCFVIYTNMLYTKLKIWSDKMQERKQNDKSKKNS